MAKYIVAGGVLVILGMAIGAGTVYGLFKDKSIRCTCVKVQGDPVWYGNCPEEIKPLLTEKYGALCR